jgi:hypothetical protein
MAKAKTPPFPLENVDASWLPPKMVKYVAEYFRNFMFDEDEFLYHATSPHVKNSSGQKRVAQLHQKLNEKGWLELWCLSLMAYGLEPDVMIKEGHYESGYISVGTTALDMILPETAFWHADAKLLQLLEANSTNLMDHAIAGLSAPRSNKFCFEHEMQIRALLALAINQNSEKLPELVEAITAPPVTSSALAEAFALFGTPSVQTLTVAGLQLIGWRQALQGEGNRLSRGFMSDFVSCLVNCAYYWILAGTPVTHAVSEVQRRLECLVPLLFPGRKPNAYKAQIRNLVGRLLARHPDAWGCFGFTVSELLGPSVLDHMDSRDENAYTDVLEGFLSGRRTGKDFQKFGIKQFSKSHPEIREPINVVRTGSRSSAWSSPDGKYDSVAPLLNLMKDHDMYHPVLKGTTSVEILTEVNCLKILMEFLETGSQHSKDGSMRAIERFPGLIDTVLPKVTTKSHAKRIASIHLMTAAQLATFSLELRGAIFHTSLGL